MVARERRRPAAASSLRGALVVLLLGLGAVAILRPFSGGGGGGAGEAAPSEGGVVAAEKPPPRPDPSVPARPLRRADPALEAQLRTVVEKYVSDAMRRRKDVSRSDVSVAVHLRELWTDGSLAEIGADRSFVPASNLKLVTTAAALVLLGPDGKFETRFDAMGEVRGGTLAGDLVVRAGADPLVDPGAEPAGSVRHLLDPVVRALRDAGVQRITGDLVLDEGTYATPAPGPSWPSPNQFWQDYCALAGGFTANGGCLSATIDAGAPGAAARVAVRPVDHGLEPRISVQTSAPKTTLDVRVEARAGHVVVRGKVPKDVPRWTTRFSVPDPVELFGSVLTGALRAGGITLEGSVVRKRAMPAARELFTLRTPITSVLGPINTESDNAVADQLFFRLGAAYGGAGTREAGGAAVRAALERLDISTDGLVQVDGSGLSRDNRITARQITALVAAVLESDPEAARFYRASLAVGGETGTLDGRMQGAARGRVSAKTGWISGASALSGVAVTLGGRELVFSILVSYPRVSSLNKYVWKPMQDEICEVLVQYAPESKPVEASASSAGTSGSDG